MFAAQENKKRTLEDIFAAEDERCTKLVKHYYERVESSSSSSSSSSSLSTTIDESFLRAYIQHSIHSLFQLVIPVDSKTTWHYINDVGFSTTIRKTGVSFRLTENSPPSSITILLSVSFQYMKGLQKNPSYTATANWIAKEVATCFLAYMTNDPLKTHRNFQPYKAYQLRITARCAILERDGFCMTNGVLQFPLEKSDEKEVEGKKLVSKICFMCGTFAIMPFKLKIYKNHNYDDPFADHEKSISQFSLSTYGSFDDIVQSVNTMTWGLSADLGVQEDYIVTYVSDNVFVGNGTDTRTVTESENVFKLYDTGPETCAQLSLVGGAVSAMHFSNFEPIK